MAMRSPVVSGAPFTLPFSHVLGPASGDDRPEDGDSSPHPSIRLAVPGDRPVAYTNRFLNIGVPRNNPGIQHSVYFTRRPVVDRYTVEEEFRVSGYLSYHYLHSGSMVVGVVFCTDRSQTIIEEYKLAVRGRELGKNYVPNFNLEKLGLLIFTADNSSTLVIPNNFDSSLLVRSD